MVLIVLAFVTVVMRDVIVAVTVITWVLMEFSPIVVQIRFAGEKGPIVRLEFLVQSVATHGHFGGLVLVVTNFVSTRTQTNTRIVLTITITNYVSPSRAKIKINATTVCCVRRPIS